MGRPTESGTSDESDPVHYSVSRGVATIGLRRPDALNALDGRCLELIGEAVRRAEHDLGVHAVVFRGDHRAFSTGIDLHYLEHILADNGAYFRFVEHFNAVLRAVEDCSVPTIAVVEGYALAGGLELLLACDLAIAASGSWIGDQHANVGLVPGGGSTQRLPRRVGEQRAKELLFSGRRVSAEEAERIGLVLESVEPDRLDETLEAHLERLRSKSRMGISYIKRAVQRGSGLPVPDGLRHEAHAVAEYFTSSSSPEIGIAAFRSRTDPIFEE